MSLFFRLFSTKTNLEVSVSEPPAALDPDWLQRLWWIPDRSLFALASSERPLGCSAHLLQKDIRLAAISQWHLGLCS